MLNITAYGQNIPYVQKCQDIRFIDLEILQYVNPQVMNWFFMVIVTALALYSTSNTADIINFVIIGISAIFNYFGWIQVSSGFLALAAVLTIGSFISKKYKGEI
jgi:hypothetical protein